MVCPPPPYTCTRSFIARGGSPRFCSFHQLFFCFCPSTCFLRGVSQWTEMEMVKKKGGGSSVCGLDCCCCSLFCRYEPQPIEIDITKKKGGREENPRDVLTFCESLRGKKQDIKKTKHFAGFFLVHFSLFGLVVFIRLVFGVCSPSVSVAPTLHPPLHPPRRLSYAFLLGSSLPPPCVSQSKSAREQQT